MIHDDKSTVIEVASCFPILIFAGDVIDNVT